jgi:L-ascorbate metabolism protein UlaG (beta-lactamase superfamily)
MNDHPQTERIDWLGHASFRLRGSVIIYIDPWKLTTAPRDGNLILLTHNHYDHYSPNDIRKAALDNATVVVPKSIRQKVDWPKVVALAPGESTTLDGVHIVAVPAYNVNKDYHPRREGWVGYIVTLDGVRIYHSGDTDLIPEMKDVECDVALLPVSGTYVMTATEAIKAAELVSAKAAIPMHWGDIIGDDADARAFKEGASCEVVIKEPVG